GRQRIKALLRQGLAEEFAFAGWRREIAFRERRESFRHAESHPATLFQFFERESLHARMVVFDRLARNLFIGFFEAVFGEAHPFGQQPEDFAIWSGFADRLDVRLLHEPVQMSVPLLISVI